MARDFFRGSSRWTLETGQEIEVDLHADPVGGDYIWRWDTKIAAHNGHAEQSFQQSTFQGAQFTSERLRKRATDYVPVLSESGEAERWLIEAIDGSTSLQEIARTAFAAISEGISPAGRCIPACFDVG